MDIIKEYEFKTAGRNAYKADDVDDFFAEVAANYTKMFHENGELVRRVGLLADRLEKFKKEEEIVNYIKKLYEFYDFSESEEAGELDYGFDDLFKVEEKIKSTEEDRSVMGDVVAKKDAVITRIVADNGTAKYIEGSYIEKGSVLIEGRMYSELIGEYEVHASGIVRGIVEYNFEKEYKYLYNNIKFKTLHEIAEFVGFKD